jgi:hypothetical protein
MGNLQATNLHWIQGQGDDPHDLCAHSGVEFVVRGRALVAPSDGDWTVSASALYLLRTLTRQHTRDDRVGDHLFPCCGFCMYDIEGQEDVVITGCPSGMDFEVVRVGDVISLTDAGGDNHPILFADWRQAVCAFSDAVQLFYAASAPKKPHDEDDARGFEKFLKEWSRRRSLAERSV